MSKILVGDDAGLIIGLCAETLQALGYTVRGAESGEGVLDLLRTESFDLVLLDYRLPDIDGFEACDVALQTHGGYGYAKEFHVERLWREVRLYKIAPVSQQMVLNYLSEHVLGLPKSY